MTDSSILNRNRLSDTASPYLRQHKNNPVHWQPWSAEVLELARRQNKLIIVSIGYAACHWCHVMEHECFESEEVAALMNSHFINIKVDREERPDIDAVYMSAIQLMNGRGGWPLNCFCLPNQQPIYAGTYFNHDAWLQVLQQMAAIWHNEPEKALEYAAKVRDGIAGMNSFKLPAAQPPVTGQDMHKMVELWLQEVDFNKGGYGHGTKFPLPDNWLFLMQYAHAYDNKAAQAAVLVTLHNMAEGGIYDHAGGGFARYSVDGEWHVPHFEKMLYDNAQLAGLYAEAYKATGQEVFKTVAAETLSWMLDEMQDENYLFYSSLDADSEGVEGKYYTWAYDEFMELAGADAELAAEYYQVIPGGNWHEEHINILMKPADVKPLLQKYTISEQELEQAVQRVKEKLLGARAQRVRPGLDDKMLCSWNALAVHALVRAAEYLNKPYYYIRARQVMHTMLELMRGDGNTLLRVFNPGAEKIYAFAEDYACTIEALLALYRYDLDERWLQQAEIFTQTMLQHFSDDEGVLFYFTDNRAQQLITKTQQVQDDVIPCANSIMANNLYKLGIILQRDAYTARAENMLATVQPAMLQHGRAFSKWCQVLLAITRGVVEMHIPPAKLPEVRDALNETYIFNLMLMADKEAFNISVCMNKSCYPPVSTAAEAIELINNK